MGEEEEKKVQQGRRAGVRQRGGRIKGNIFEHLICSSRDSTAAEAWDTHVSASSVQFVSCSHRTSSTSADRLDGAQRKNKSFLLTD